jgi:hypothetical protein
MNSREPVDGVDDVVPVDDLSIGTLIALIARLQETETTDHYLCREVELDMVCFLADEGLKAVARPPAGQHAVDEASQIRELVLKAHDFVGQSNVHAAIAELNRVVEMKMGL